MTHSDSAIKRRLTKKELHKRRLQLKSKSKFKTKSKDWANKKSEDNGILSDQNSAAQGLKVDEKETTFLNDCEGFDSRNEGSKDSVLVHSSPKKQKLHWGYNANSNLILHLFVLFHVRHGQSFDVSVSNIL
ncbi:hypothetical protein VNO77_34966 [Canavalia gladiata]|uniref:Uncharacterized protein n=1 Tax=Canavalia gladiata TaxID=3824 RepID=A0AAN9KEU8_CANGL